MATSPPAAMTAPPTMNGRRRPRPSDARRSDQTPTARGTAMPAIALTVITRPIITGASSMRSSSTGR
jgi:hypothetical protein